MRFIFSIFSVLIVTCDLFKFSLNERVENRSFVIDYQNDQFLKDGKPFQFIAGSMHYFRAPRAYWQDRLRKFRAAGLNAVTTYVEWSFHEPSPGNYKFTGDQDLEYFVELAAKEDLSVILRPGPYICAERDFGGLPPWLMNLYPNINLRMHDADYEKEVNKWFDVLFSKMNKYLYGNGGPIILVQVENEYGSYPTKSPDHLIWLRDLMRSYVKENAVLFTTDGGAEDFLKGGAIPDVYPTVDFGAGWDINPPFLSMRKYAPRGPLVNSEFYAGWLTHWGKKKYTVDQYYVKRTMEEMLKKKANINFYMFYGGTNFGFMNGASYDLPQSRYEPSLTSYDYDAPLNEAGDPTPKYYAIRKAISQYFQLPDIPEPKPAPKGNYGSVLMKPVVSILNYSPNPEARTVVDSLPKTFEQMKSYYGYMLYEAKIPENLSGPATLSANDLRDRANIYVNEKAEGVLSRAPRIYSKPITAVPGATLRLLVENQGRINYGDRLKDEKGLLQNPTLNGKSLGPWSTTTLPFEDISWVRSLPPAKNPIAPPAIYVGELLLAANQAPLDTYIDPSGWGKGIIFVNGFNIGRYWPSVGSQVTLYVPGCYLRPAPEKNIITIFETEYTHPNSNVIFTDKPILEKIPPISYL